MRKLTTLLLCFLSVTITTVAQLQPRDYAIISMERSFSDDGTELIIDVTIENQGGDALNESIINLSLIDEADERIIATEPLQLASGEAITQRFIFNLSDFPLGSVQVFQVAAGIDLYELAGTELAENNTMTISVEIPQSGRFVSTETADFVIPFLEIPVVFEAEAVIIGDATVPHSQLLLLGGAALIVLLLLGLFIWMLRLILSKPPRFENWQPPYAGVPHLDPNSTSGRRQAWQGHAQNGSVLAVCSEGNLHPTKLLFGRDGFSMEHWEITAIRLSQYDMYGRVARSQTVAPKSILKQLNQAVRKRDSRTPEVQQKHMRQIARGLVKVFRKKIDKRSAMLPVAMDIRFMGRHGEVRIMFELYQCQNGHWQLIDNWEPEMTVIGRTIQENYTYTIHGMSGGETIKTYQSRLQDDITWLLGEMLRLRQIGQRPAEQDSLPPDTLTNMKPIANF